MKVSSFTVSLTLCLFIFSCSSQHKESQDHSTFEKESPAITKSEEIAEHSNTVMQDTFESEVKSALSSSAAVANKKDTNHQFIRTADLKFKVKNVVEATYSIERVIAKYDGFVTYTNLHSDVIDVNESPIGNDSTIETTKFTIVNSMIIRVPNYHLDTALKSMTNLVEFLDYRVIKADDVALQLLSNSLSHERNKNSVTRLNRALTQQQGKLSDINTMEEKMFERDAASDAAHLQQLELKDKIAYSTVHLELYQHPSVKHEVLLNDKNRGVYEPSMALKLWHSIYFGWTILEAVFLFVLKLWPLALFASIAYLLIKKFGK
jgi:hypothetical protein